MHNAAARRWFLRAAVIFTLLATLLALTASSAFADGWLQPSGITSQAHNMHNLYKLVVVMGLVVFVAVEGALLLFIFKYKKRGDDLPPQIHGNNLLEVIWTTIPIVIVLILFVFSFRTLLSVDKDAKPADLTVDVQGFQFQWAFTYHANDLGTKSDPNSTSTFTITGTAANEPTVVIPVGEPVEFSLTSNDVIHAFYVRDFLYKLDVIPGRNNRFVVTARETGTFTGQCAELCGLNHSLMRFHLQVVTRDEFDAFIQKNAKPAKAAAAPAK